MGGSSASSLPFKAATTSAVLVASAVMAVAAVSAWHARDELLAERGRAAQSLAQSLARESAASRGSGDIAQLERLASSLAADNSVAFVAFIGTGDLPLASFVRDLAAFEAWRSTVPGAVGAPASAEPGRLILGAAPAVGAEARVVLALEPRPEHGLWALLRPRLVWSLAAAALAGVAVLPLVWPWSRRLEKLVEATDKIFRGDLEEKITDPGTDEIGVLSLAYENMRR